MDEIGEIKASTKVIDIIKNFPELTEYFLNLGICGCGYKFESDYYWNIEKVAKEKGLDLKSLLEELNIRIKKHI
ncbi:MAG: hypothetical protein HY752_08450 [Nitrospirae bacterium]|nr:hypothetical protein [Nitrospirota bacterium]